MAARETASTVLMKNNTVRNYDASGIALEVVEANTAAPVQLVLNATLIGNLVAEPNPDSAFTGLVTVQGNVPGADVNTTLNLKLGGAGAEQNNFTAADPADFNDVFVYQGAAPDGDFNLTQANSGRLIRPLSLRITTYRRWLCLLMAVKQL